MYLAANSTAKFGPTMKQLQIQQLLLRQVFLPKNKFRAKAMDKIYVFIYVLYLNRNAKVVTIFNSRNQEKNPNFNLKKILALRQQNRIKSNFWNSQKYFIHIFHRLANVWLHNFAKFRNEFIWSDRTECECHHRSAFDPVHRFVDVTFFWKHRSIFWCRKITTSSSEQMHRFRHRNVQVLMHFIYPLKTKLLGL